MKNILSAFGITLISLSAFATEPTQGDREKAYIILEKYSVNSEILMKELETIETLFGDNNSVKLCLNLGKIEGLAYGINYGVGSGAAGNFRLEKITGEKKINDLRNIVTVSTESLTNKLLTLQDMA